MVIHTHTRPVGPHRGPLHQGCPLRLLRRGASPGLSQAPRRRVLGRQGRGVPARHSQVYKLLRPSLHVCECVPGEEGGQAGNKGLEVAVVTITPRRRDALTAPLPTSPPLEDAARMRWRRWGWRSAPRHPRMRWRSRRALDERHRMSCVGDFSPVFSLSFVRRIGEKRIREPYHDGLCRSGTGCGHVKEPLLPLAFGVHVV